MKERKAKIIDIRAKLRRKAAGSQTSDLNQRLPLPKATSIQSATTAIKPLQLQPAQAAQLPSTPTRWQQLAAQAELINQLSAELEAAMFELKAIACDINCDRRSKQNMQQLSHSVCEYLAAIVPYVRQEKSGNFVLTSHSVDLFQAEREAMQVAQILRCQASRKGSREVG